MEDPSLCVQIDMIHATFGNGETFTKALEHVASTAWYAPSVSEERRTHPEPIVLLLLSDRQLWIFRMERDRASCDEDWLRPFSDPLQYRYKNEDTGEIFISTNINAK